MRKKQTIKVKDLKKQVNDYLKFDTLNQDEKKALCIMLEHILSKTGNYQGYDHLTWLNGGYNQWHKDGMPDFPEKDKYILPEYDRVYY